MRQPHGRIFMANQPYTLLGVTSSHLLGGQTHEASTGRNLHGQSTFHIAWSDIIHLLVGQNPWGHHWAWSSWSINLPHCLVFCHPTCSGDKPMRPPQCGIRVKIRPEFPISTEFDLNNSDFGIIFQFRVSNFQFSKISEKIGSKSECDI